MSRCSSRDVLFWSDPSAPEDKAVSAEVAAKDIRLGILLCKRFPLYSREGLKNEVVAVVLADGQRSPTIKPPCAILKETGDRCKGGVILAQALRLLGCEMLYFASDSSYEFS
eukprot:6728326-Ditylum_brightwellii.AAC.1